MTNEELDKARAEHAYEQSKAGDLFTDIAIHAARLAREGWMPPVAVDPDREEAITLAKSFGLAHYIPLLDAIKRGRALAAEAKPGLVWVKHDGSAKCPVDIHQPVLITHSRGFYNEALAGTFNWHHVTHYAVITPPDDVA